MRCQYRGVTQSQYNLQVVTNEGKVNLKFQFIQNRKALHSKTRGYFKAL